MAARKIESGVSAAEEAAVEELAEEVVEMPIDAEEPAVAEEPVPEAEPEPMTEEAAEPEPEPAAKKAPTRRNAKPQDAAKILPNNQVRKAYRPGDVVTLDREGGEDDSDLSDIAWHDLRDSQIRQKVLTGMLTGVERHSVGEGLNVWIAVVNYGGYRVMIPLSEMNINPGTGDDSEKRLTRIAGSMVGSEIDFIVTNTEEKGRAASASRAKAMKRKMRDFYIEKQQLTGEPIITPGRIVEARVTGTSETLVRLEVFGVECLVRTFELMERWIADARDEAAFSIGSTINVRVTDIEIKDDGDVKVSVEGRSLDTADTHRCEKQGRYRGVITGFNKGTYFIHLDIGANAVAQQYGACDRPPKKKDAVHFVCTAWDEERNTAAGIITKVISPYRG